MANLHPIQQENIDLRAKLKAALARCAEMENNPVLKKALEKVSSEPEHHDKKKLDTGHKHP